MPFCYATRHSAKALKPKDYVDNPETLGQHLKKRRRELGLFQREAATMMGVATATVVNWENGKTQPTPAQSRPVLDFLGYDPFEANTLTERVTGKQRELGVTLAQIARYLDWDPSTLHHYLHGAWGVSPERQATLEAFLAADSTTLGQIHRLRRQR